MRKDAALPDSVVVREVCPRDGFQNVKEFIPTERKLEWIDALFEAGVTEMEVTSFVSPKAIPQLADAAEVLKSPPSILPNISAIVYNSIFALTAFIQFTVNDFLSEINRRGDQAADDDRRAGEKVHLMLPPKSVHKLSGH